MRALSKRYIEERSPYKVLHWMGGSKHCDTHTYSIFQNVPEGRVRIPRASTEPIWIMGEPNPSYIHTYSYEEYYVSHVGGRNLEAEYIGEGS